MTGDRGSASVIAIFLAGTMAVATIGLGSLASLYNARSHAGAAADAAALAAAVATYPLAGSADPVSEARKFALLNGAIVKRCDCEVDPSLRSRIATVIVELKVPVPFFGVVPVRAGARSEFDPMLWLGR